MNTRKGIADALARTSGSRRATPVAESPQAAPASTVRAINDPENPHFRPSRQGKSNVTGYFPAEVKKQLRMLAAEEDKTIQQLLGESLNMLFARYNKAEIAPIDRE